MCHLISSRQQKQIAGADAAMLKDFERRFASILNTSAVGVEFNPLPVAACLCDPRLVGILFAEQLILLDVAKKFVAEEVCKMNNIYAVLKCTMYIAHTYS